MKIKPRMIFAHMRSAQAYAVASYSQRLKVGCVIVDEDTDQPIAIGWNGTAPGEPNVCEVEVDGKLVSQGVIHAEINAMLRTPYRDNPDSLVMFVTHSPCPDCTAKIIQSGIKTLVYADTYRIPEGIFLLLEAGIEVYRVINDIAVVKEEITTSGTLGGDTHCWNPDLRPLTRR